MPQLSIFRPRPEFDLGNEVRHDENCTSLPDIDCRQLNRDLVEVFAQQRGRPLVKAGPYPAHIDQAIALARRKQQPADAPNPTRDGS